MFSEMQPKLEKEKRVLEKQGHRKHTVLYFVILIIVGVLFISGLLLFMGWYTPAKFRAIERFFIKREGPGQVDVLQGAKNYSRYGLTFSHPPIYALEYETPKSSVFAGTQEDGQLFPSVLSLNYPYTIDYDQLRLCKDTVFREGITNQCKEDNAKEKSVNGYPYKEFNYTGGKGGEEKLRLLVIQFQNQPVEITHLLLNGVENKLDEILPTFQFSSN